MSNQVPPILPLAPVERIIRKAGADRVAEDAGVELAKVLEEYGIEISREAITLAKTCKEDNCQRRRHQACSCKVKKAKLSR